MDTLGSILNLIKRLLLVNLAMLILLVTAPLLAFVPLILTLIFPHAYFGGLAIAYMVLGPFASAGWMIIICHLPSFRKAQKRGLNGHEWRELQGGMIRTVPKAVGFMFLGLFGSFATEAIYYTAWHFLVRPLFDEFAITLFFVGVPFAASAPIWITQLVRYRRNKAEQKFYADLRAKIVEEKQQKAEAADAAILSELGVRS